jgi:hypothetical protein
MQSIHKLIEILSDRGRRRLCLERVYRHLSREDLLVEAYAKIGKNDGALTRGIDGETVDGMSREKVQAISQILRDGDWIWSPVRRIHIPKKNGKTRPLGIPICHSYCTSSQRGWGLSGGTPAHPWALPWS